MLRSYWRRYHDQILLKEKLENAAENNGHIYDNTGKSMEQETEEIAALIKNGSLIYEKES